PIGGSPSGSDDIAASRLVGWCRSTLSGGAEVRCPVQHPELIKPARCCHCYRSIKECVAVWAGSDAAAPGIAPRTAAGWQRPAPAECQRRRARRQRCTPTTSPAVYVGAPSTIVLRRSEVSS